MDVFDLRDRIIRDYTEFVRSFVTIRDQRIDELVERELEGGRLWPDPLIQLNPAFEPGEPMQDLVDQGLLQPECLKIFCAKNPDGSIRRPFRLHKHQVESIQAARAEDNYVLTTGTGSGKSLSYIVPIVDHVLRRGSGQGVQAIVVYPMNALANSQVGELEKFLCRGFDKPPVTFRRYTGQESDEERKEIIASPPDIILTNYVMLELVLTRPKDRKLIHAAQGLRFLALDELHTYRGRQGADVSLLVRRLREACNATDLLHVGTSATMASGESWPDQQEEVAQVASLLFGATVKPERVIGETLKRVTPLYPMNDPVFLQALKERLASGTLPAAGNTAAFRADPLSSWMESTLGLREAGGRLVRCKPRSLTGKDGASKELADLTGAEEASCKEALEQMLMRGYQCKDDNGRALFAFRQHQFVSKGESVYASPEAEDNRHITLQPQKYVPGSDRSRVLLPVAFCRECGQEFYVVRRSNSEHGVVRYLPRNLTDRIENDDGQPGYLYINTSDPWPSESHEVNARLPDAWLEPGSQPLKVKKSRTKNLPKEVFISAGGVEGVGDLRAHYMRAPFLYCPNCRVAYSPYQRSDYGKLSTLGSEGRSTATTVMSMSSVRHLRRDESLEQKARKLLSFTDNRQDASLQAGHFNDFVEIALLRSALWRAVQDAGPDGIRHDQLTMRVFRALDLPLSAYAENPRVEYVQREETERAFREALGYYLYRDLQRGWRIASPNLEQCGLLDMDYAALETFCTDEPKWENFHPALATATPEVRAGISRVVLDFMRRELAIRVDFLNPERLESIQQLSSQYLIPPWSLADEERPERARVVFPRSRSGDVGPRDRYVYLSARGGMGLYLRRQGTFPDFDNELKVVDSEAIIRELLDALCIPGLLDRVMEPRKDDEVPGYQLNAAALIWRAGDGTRAAHDPVRLPGVPSEGLRTNPFFTAFYKGDTTDLQALEAREHTAQVPSEDRLIREERFREARLPVLYCSPTMELGVDISQLNVVNMRNIPPTPANYAQRSGRAGRSGQPAFVFAYCSAGSHHDQYFFKRPEKMVAGSVATPRLDLGNEDLLRAHVHAIWLEESGLHLGRSLSEILDVTGEEPSLAIKPEVQQDLDSAHARAAALKRARSSLGEAVTELVGEDGDVDDWLRRVLDQVPHSFLMACRRWKGLYRSALEQARRQSRIVQDASRSSGDRQQARRLRAESEAQLQLLLETGGQLFSDFYSYRYFASEGFLPGYNFPRLPLSAYLPGRRRKQGRDEYLTRPRFLAISEFGPRTNIYHEGSRYLVNKVILPVDAEERSLKERGVICAACGYYHQLGDEPAPDLCEQCETKLPAPFENLFRMQNVATRRRDRITSDEEERQRLGYELKTALRFSRREGRVSARTATLNDAGGMPLANLTYGHAATLWRINLGWRRRRDKDQLGYVLDVERGYWARNQAVEDDPEDPMSARTQRVIPFVEDTRNCLLVEPTMPQDLGTMASLEAALKAAAQIYFQLEDSELATQPLPTQDQRRLILLYEASEGGAGVLRRLVEDPKALPAVAKLALEVCHFDPESGEDHHQAPGDPEECVAACYNCLLSYFNQGDHDLLDRHMVRHHMLDWSTGSVSTSPAPRPRGEQVQRLMNLTDSSLERRWLGLVDRLGLQLPSDAQALIEDCHARPDFLYKEAFAAIFIDGPPHDSPGQREKDRKQQDCLEDMGYTVIRFHHADDWDAILRRFPSLFGEPLEQPGPGPVVDPEPEELELDLFDEPWHVHVLAFANHEGIFVEAGEDVMDGGQVVGMTVAFVSAGGRHLHILDADIEGADLARKALEAAGHQALELRAGDMECLQRVLTALEVE